MGTEALSAVELAGSATHDLSLWGLFLQADLVVKTVMIMLFMASVWCWAIIFEKVRRIKRVTAQAERFEQEFWSGGSLEKLHDRIGVNPDHPLAVLFSAVMREWRRAAEPGRVLTGSVQTRIGQVMRVSIDREMELLESHIGFLASVGSTAPFVGLFGTVWGIMNSFSSIAMSKNTSLVVVAPGIAEALFATALGLLAAIPAVIAYNKISHDLARYNNRLETFAGEFATILSRQIDEGGN
jgi:biopolymer transport protein TolQ